MPADKLNDRQIKARKSRNQQVTVWDGRGLYRLVKPSGSKLWQRKCRFEGREHYISYAAPLPPR